MTEHCVGCGHIFYNGAPLDKTCHYCKSEPEEKCYVCGKPATCTGNFGYMCHSKYCIASDERASYIKYMREVERDPDYEYY